MFSRTHFNGATILRKQLGTLLWLIGEWITVQNLLVFRRTKRGRKESMRMSTTARLSCYTTPRKYEMNAPVQQEMTYIRFCKLCMCGESKREKKKRLKNVFFLYVHVLWMTLKMMGKLKNGRICWRRRVEHVFVFAVVIKKYWSLSYKMKAEGTDTIIII